MSESEMMAVASRLHVLLRRKANRITDILWMISNAEYAGEVLRLARAEADDEMHALAARFEAMMPAAAPDALRRAQIEREKEAAAKPARDYIGTLR